MFNPNPWLNLGDYVTLFFSIGIVGIASYFIAKHAEGELEKMTLEVINAYQKDSTIPLEVFAKHIGISTSTARSLLIQLINKGTLQGKLSRNSYKK
jgi:hypothetical protein